MPRPARLLLAAALALVALSPAGALADEPQGAAGHVHGHHHHRRRAKLEETVGRASRGGAAIGEGAAISVHARRPAEKAESIGAPNDGHLRGGVHLDVSKPYLRVVPSSAPYDARWGLPSLVNMIDRAARGVHKRFPGAVLDVADLSHKGGGDLLRHHSHESGRDADLGYYALDARGRQIHARTLIRFDPNMASPTVPGARYDLPRNWTLVQELLTDPGARVSHIFVAEWIRHQLLVYARPRVSRALWDRAAMVMMQPHNSLPHDDHFHVRISCPREAHSACIELARNAPHGRLRVARKGHAGGVRALKTPVRAMHTAKAPAASAPAPRPPTLVVPPPAAAPPAPPPPSTTPALQNLELDVEPREAPEDGTTRVTD